MPSSIVRFAVKFCAVLLASALLLLPCYYFVRAERRTPEAEPQRILLAYLRAAYAHDFKKAYEFLSTQDRHQKSEKAYITEKGPFQGFSLDVARKLADFIEGRPLSIAVEGAQKRIKLTVRLPDANSLSELLHNWEEDKLNALPKNQQLKILAEIDRLQRTRQLKTITGEEEFVVVQEGSSWRVFLDWASGMQISYNATVPTDSAIEALPLAKETTVRASELFTVAYRVKNRSDQNVTTRIVHRVEPKELVQHIDIVECALLLPVKMSPGQEAEFSTTYMVRSDLPDGVKNLSITYDFQVEPKADRVINSPGDEATAAPPTTRRAKRR